jgi:hypothetical protein
MPSDTRSYAIILFGEALSHPGFIRDGGMSSLSDLRRGRLRSEPHGHTVQKPRTASFCSPCSRRGIALHRSRFGIAYRCVSAIRISRAATRFITGPASGNRLSAGHQGTRSRSTSAQPTGWTFRRSPAPALRGPASRSPPRAADPLSRKPPHGVALGRRLVGEASGSSGARRVVIRLSGAHLRSVDAPSAVVSWTSTLHDRVTKTGFTAHRPSTGGLSAACFIGSLRSTSRRAASLHRIDAGFQATERRSASSSVAFRCGPLTPGASIPAEAGLSVPLCDGSDA